MSILSQSGAADDPSRKLADLCAALDLPADSAPSVVLAAVQDVLASLAASASDDPLAQNAETPVEQLSAELKSQIKAKGMTEAEFIAARANHRAAQAAAKR